MLSDIFSLLEVFRGIAPAGVLSVQRTASASSRLPDNQDFQINLKVGLLLKKPDFQALRGKSLTEVAHHADKLANSGIEDKLHAHVLLSSILEQLPTSEAGALSPLTGKLWSLEKSLHWHDRYFSQAGQDKRIKDAFSKTAETGFSLRLAHMTG